MVIDKEQKAIEKVGCQNVKCYCLADNYGYTFEKCNTEYDLRHWLNCYGVDVDYWTISSKDAYIQVDTLADALELISNK